MSSETFLKMNPNFSLIGSTDFLLKHAVDENHENPLIPFDFGTITEGKFGSARLVGQLPVIIPQEYFVEHEEGLVEEGVSVVLKFLEEFGAIDDISRKKAYHSAYYVVDAFSTYFPARSLLESKARLLCALFTAGILYDDVMERADFLVSNPSNIVKCRQICTQFINGNDIMADLKNILPLSLHPSVEAIHTGLVRLKLIVQDLEEIRRPIAQIVIDGTTSLFLLKVEGEGAENPISDQNYRNIRIHDGLYATIHWLIGQCRGLKLPDEIKSSSLFGAVLDHFGGICVATNDVVGLKRDVLNAKSLVDNLILYRVKHRNFSLQDSFDLRCSEVRAELEALRYACKALRILYPDSQELDEVLLIICSAAQAALKGGKYDRYQNIDPKI